MTVILVFVFIMRQRSNFDIVAIVANALRVFSCRLLDITNCFTDVNGICDARHILLPRGSLPTRHQTRGHNEYR